MSTAQASSPRFGAVGYAAVALVALGLLLVVRARSEVFVHGEELFWALSYFIPLFIGLLALVLGAVHLVRGRLRSPVAWAPVSGALALVLWLIAFLYFDAFR